MGVGLLTAIIVGGIAGWIAENIMKSEMGILKNVLLGVAGAFLASLVFGLVGVKFAGILGYLVAAIAGSCGLIFIGRQMRS
ncbi:MAG: GlsB/YeaQ/YmgE family stress response membrane protein [Pseudomonadota bacterium]